MTSREKFEAWFLAEHEEVENSNELSAKVMKMMAWQSWQAAEIAAEKKLTDMAVQLANAESKCRELAAENVTLNDKMNKLATWHGIEFYSSAWEFCNLDGNDALEFMCDVKTPATDSFLDEVRAQGVEMAACALDDVNQFNYANMLDDLAQKLRKDSNTADPLAAGIITEVGE
ncbi:TPA: hypothetical protein R8G25_002298 [Citrobacter freundii]|nr:hypothetical protein [Citrobacter freundii]HEE9924407.1 hypothetical protein [Citrobacter freundii]